MPERAVVTGAAGFIGSALVRRLVARGAQVVALDALLDDGDRDVRRARFADLAGLGARTVHADLRHEPTAAVLDGADVVYHCAGRAGVRESWARFADYAEHNMIATDALLRGVRAAGVPRVVLSSSSSVYGSTARSGPATVDPTTPYAVSKLGAEQLCAAHARDGGPDVVVLRYFTVYGPGQRSDMAFHRFVRAASLGLPVPLHGDGAQLRDFTYVDDVVEANLRAATAPVAGLAVVDVGPGRPRTLREALDLVEEYVGRPLRLDPAPTTRGEATATRADTRGTRALLGWAPGVQLEDGLRRQVAHQVAGYGAAPVAAAGGGAR